VQRKINEAQERIIELRRKNHELQLQNVKSTAKATQLQKQLVQYRNISALMTSKNARRNALLEQLVLNDHVVRMPFYFYATLFYFQYWIII
jgi:hypothetical protein